MNINTNTNDRFWQSRIFWIWVTNLVLAALLVMIAHNVGYSVSVAVGGAPTYKEASMSSYSALFDQKLPANAQLWMTRLGVALMYAALLFVNLILITGKTLKQMLVQWHAQDNNNSPVIVFAMLLAFLAFSMSGTGLNNVTSVDLALRTGLFHGTGIFLTWLLNGLTGIKSFSMWGQKFEASGTDSVAWTTVAAFAISAAIFLVV